jgi:crossover junction endodeoxyribonuclease RuvC
MSRRAGHRSSCRMTHHVAGDAQSQLAGSTPNSIATNSPEPLSAASATGPLPSGSTGGYVIGIDPGLLATGYAVLAYPDARVCEAGIVRGGRGTLPQRLQTIHQGVVEVLEQYHPAEMALEELYSHYERPRTAILMGHARGVICLAAALHAVPIFSYAATHVKRMITGSGRSPKIQMQQAICRELRLPKLPQPADVADALAIALCHVYARRRPLLPDNVVVYNQ